MANETATLVRLRDTGLTLAHEEEDVRGMTVVDRNGDEIGHVEDLFIDETQRRLRFLEIGSGGFLGIGKEKRLIPVDAIMRVDEQVHIDQERSHVAASPGYDPELTPMPEPPTIEEIYGHYGYIPFWGPGYMYPIFPSRRPKR